jgi:hypothetical protein
MHDLERRLRELDVLEPPDLEARLEHRLAASGRLQPLHSPRRWWAFAMAAVVTMVLIGGSILLLVPGDGGVAGTTTVPGTTTATTAATTTVTTQPVTTTTAAPTTTPVPPASTTTQPATTTTAAPVATIPNVVGMAPADAEAALSAAGLSVEFSETIPFYAVDPVPGELWLAEPDALTEMVAMQDPAGGEVIGTTRSVVVNLLEDVETLRGLLTWEDDGTKVGGTWHRWLPDCVRDLEIAPDGSLWIVCGGSLQSFDGSWRYYGDHPEEIVDIAFTDSGDIVAATGFGALWVGTNPSDGAHDWIEGPPGYAFDVAAAPDGSVWAGTGDVLVRYADGVWEEMPGTEGWQLAFGPDGVAWSVGPESGIRRWGDPPSSPFGDYRGAEDLWISPDGDVWVLDDALRRFDGVAWTDHLPGLRVVDVSFAEDGSVWAVSEFAGAYRFDGIGWARYTVDDGLSSDALTAVVVADDGVVWIGSRVAGVMRFTPSG